MQRQLQLIITQVDEAELSRRLRKLIAGIKFLNDNVWPEDPEVREGIEECNSGRAYLYNGALDALPTARRKFGDVEGPIAGCVIQVLRPRMVDSVLLSGRIAVGFDESDLAMRTFMSQVWRCVKTIGTIGVLRPDGLVDRHYLVGADARAQCDAGRIRLADRAIGLEYMPIKLE
jgi:hypothetical protein